MRWALLAAGLLVYSAGTAATHRLTYGWCETEHVRFSGSLHGAWLWPRAGAEPFPAAIFANGASGTLEHNLPLAIELTKHGVACFLFDFAGQGGSSGKWDPTGDLAKAIDHVRTHPRIDPARIAGVGHSMGARLLSERAADFRGVVLFGNVPSDAPNQLVAYSRFEFLFDRPSGEVADGPWTDHLTGPMDAVLLRASLDWLGPRLGFARAFPVTEAWRLLARLVALFGGALVLIAALLFLPGREPSEPEVFRSPLLWITAAGTLILPVVLLRRERPVFRIYEGSVKAALSGALLFALVYVLSIGAFSWSYFDVVLHFRKLGIFVLFALVLTAIAWHDRAILFEAGSAWAALCRWPAIVLVFAIHLVAGGRPGAAYFLTMLGIVASALEAFAARVSRRTGHPLGGAAFQGMTWAWLWTVFLPM